MVRTESRIDYQWGDGEQVAPGVIARNLGVRWTADFTPTTSGEMTFEVKGDDRCRLIIDGQKCLEADTKGGYHSFTVMAGQTYKVVLEYWQNADNAEVKLDMGSFEKAGAEVIASRVKDADVIVFVGGISAKLEGEEMPVSIPGFKGGDRTNIELPAVQTEMMKALKATGKPVVFVNLSGSAIGFGWEEENIPGILQAWYGGQAGGEAIADVLFGNYNPGGRLPVTFYKSVNDLPDFEDYSMANRTYRYFKGTPLYPFGFGLSYTTFRYSNLQISRDKANGNKLVKVTLTNTGKVAGDEVVQLYLSHRNAAYRTPTRTLKGFNRITLKAGEVNTITFNLGDKELSEIDEKGNVVAMKGTIEISVGGGQPSARLIAVKQVLQEVITINGK